MVLLRKTGGGGEDTSHRFDFYTQPTEKLARLCRVNVAKMANRKHVFVKGKVASGTFI